MSGVEEKIDLLSIANFQISTPENKQLVLIPQLSVKPGEIHAIIGESGSGKSLTLLSIIGLLNPKLVQSGTILFDEHTNVLNLAEKEWLTLRGKAIGMVFQEPMTALNPQQTCGKQLMEAAKIHGASQLKAQELISAKFLDLGLQSLQDRILESYPHQLSGGQRQRVMIAIACLHNPPLILADEPTTALDSVSRKAVMDDLYRLCKKQGSALLWVSHELDLVAAYADSVTVLRKGELLDQGMKQDVLGFSQYEMDSVMVENANPRNQYVKELLSALPKDKPALRNQDFSMVSKVLTIKDIVKIYPNKRSSNFRALNSVSIDLHSGETTALVGLSGSGKSTLAKILVGLEKITQGEIWLNGKKLPKNPPTGIQMVFQDPYSSLNPNQTARMALVEIFKQVCKQNALEAELSAKKAMEEVGLSEQLLESWPHELSGGQRQRLCIAKALATQPQVLILDEAVAALDPIVQKQVLELLVQLQNQRGIAYLFITHNLHVARNIAHKIVYLENGEFRALPRDWDVV